MGLEVVGKRRAHNIQHRGTVNIVMHHSRLAAAFRGSIARRGMAPASPLTNPPLFFPFPPPSLNFITPGCFSPSHERFVCSWRKRARRDKIPWRELWGRLLGRWSKGEAVLERGLITGTRSPRSEERRGGVAFGGVRLEIFRCSSPFSGRRGRLERTE